MKQLIEELQNLTGKKLVLEATTVHPAQLEPGSVFTGSKDTYVVIRVDGGRKYYNFVVVKRSDMTSALNGNRKLFYGYRMGGAAQAELHGKISPDQLKSLQNVLDGIEQTNYEKKQEIYNKNRATNQVSYSFEDRGYILKFEDGSKAKIGSRVWVRFDNGNFPGEVKSIAGNDLGRIGVVFPGRQKARMVNVERVLRLA